MKPKDDDAPIDEQAGLETARRIMKRLVETPHKPHQPLGVRSKPKERSASKGRVHKGKTRS
jgi:hypothetical protein